MIRALKCPTVLTGLLLILVCLVAKEATGSFVRNDSYEFRGLHALSIHGRDPDHLFLDLGSEADFRRFRFFIKANSQLGPDPQGYWWLNSVEMDINDDGIVEVTTSTQQYYNYTFPEPPNGIQQDHAIRFRMYFTNANNQGTWRTVYITVTVYASPRVYVNTDASTLIQLRDQDCTNRTPVLVVEGLDPANHAYPDVVYGRIAPFVNQALYPSGKEVFVLNFANGGGSMRDNAAVLQDALDAITELCPTKHIAVVGISMGGVITRYALAKAEAESRRHNVGLFISYDSPQVMAHANHGLQDEVRLHPTVGALASIQTLLSSTAAKELLEYNTYDPTSAIHQGFYNELNAYNGDGYPDESYNAAIADGNYGASWPISYVGTDLGTLTAYVEGVWNGSPDIIHVVASATDCASGSLTKISTSQTAVIFPTTLSIPLLPLLFNAYFEASINFDPVIVPTWSALHLVGYGVDPSTGNVSPVGQSKFDATYVQPTRLYHTDFSEGTAEKVLSWLGRSASLTVNYILPEGGTIVADQHTYAILDVASVAIPPKVATINGQQVTYTFSQWDDGSTENP
ncbi:MAG TPA: alpha/beta fold hydrolase, partial [Nitrospiraceae bacterium]|nr:alpha/beta fold hydrolase [Nitrospiraceae bacterium]